MIPDKANGQPLGSKANLTLPMFAETAVQAAGQPVIERTIAAFNTYQQFPMAD
jgi:hypothetical protein